MQGGVALRASYLFVSCEGGCGSDMLRESGRGLPAYMQGAGSLLKKRSTWWLLLAGGELEHLHFNPQKIRASVQSRPDMTRR